MPVSLKKLELGPFVPGMDNRRPEFRMRGTREDGGDFVRQAVNVDISSKGTLKRRKGYAKVVSGSDCHSFWADGADAFYVDGAVLYRLRGLGTTVTKTAVFSGLAPGRFMSYDKTPNGVYCTNGQVIGRLVGDALVAVAPPAPPAPSTAAITGSLRGGRYGFCVTFTDVDGRESPAYPTWVDVAAGAGVRLTGLPTAFPPRVASMSVYATLPNDALLCRIAKVATPQSTFDVSVNSTLGARCQTVLYATLPAGDIVRHHRGRLVVASGDVLYYSDAFTPGLMNPGRNYIPFPAPITVVESTANGVWVCADQTYWLPGDVETGAVTAVLPYGAVRGSSGRVPNETSVFWMSPRGLVVASDNGSATNRQEARVAVAPAEFSAGLFRETDGLKQFAESQFAVKPNRLAAASFMEAEIVRKGVSL